MMLDPKRTFDELIERIAADPARAEEIKANRIYRELSTAVSGSQEFTAVAKLFELDRDGDFDLLVLDTPPSRNALDFLDAPGRLTSFLEGRALKAFIRPTGLGMKVLSRGAAPFLAALRRVTGVDLLSDLTTFFGLLGDMTEDFSERAAQVEKLLRAPTTAFVLVTSAQPAAIDEAVWFRRTLGEGGLPFAGVIVNRVHHDLLADGDLDERAGRARRDARRRPGRPGRREPRRLPRARPPRRARDASGWRESSATARRPARPPPRRRRARHRGAAPRPPLPVRLRRPNARR